MTLRNRLAAKDAHALRARRGGSVGNGVSWNPTQILGVWFMQRWRSRLADSGDIQAVTQQLRRASIPLAGSRIVLLSREAQA